MLSKKMIERLTYQLNREIWSGYFYLGMSYYAESIGLKGFANWFRYQWKEELFHAEKFAQYLNQKRVRVVLDTIERPPQDFTNAKELFDKTLEHEKKVTRLINDLVNLAKNENDKDTENFLQWFVKEQVEEEAAPSKIIKEILEKGNNEKGLAETDVVLAKRK